MAVITDATIHMGFCYDVQQAIDVAENIKDKKMSIDPSFRHRFQERVLYVPLSLSELTSVRDEGLFVMEHDGKPCYLVKELEIMFLEVPLDGVQESLDHLCELYGEGASWIEVRKKVAV